MFDSMEEFFKSPSCYGCPFINAASEYTDRSHPVRRICEQHYEFVLTNMEQFAREANLNKPRLLAEEIVTLIMVLYSLVYKRYQRCRQQGKRMAEMIITQHKK